MKIKSRPYHDYLYPDPKKAISRTQRPEYNIIKEWIEPNSKVLDLGCGNGSLGEILIKEKNCEVHGIEIDKNGVKQAIRKGVHATQGNMDMGLNFPDDSFDYTIINVTLQMVYRPDLVATEALRVGKKAIISFPNFAHIYARFEMLLLGRMPRSPLFGYKWYNTRHIHMFSYKDFIEFMKELNAKVIKKEFLWLDSKTKNILARLFPNLFSGTVILMVQKKK
jgi:methionine biosynthesis protein MetW